jgi:hypothetical protein
VALLAVVGLAGCAKRFPKDSVEARPVRLERLQGVRFCRLALYGGERTFTGALQVALYDTTGRNDEADPRDSCPAAPWEKLDPAALSDRLDVWSVVKDGPRFWALDWMELPMAPERSFGPLKARWVGQRSLPEGARSGERWWVPFTPEKVGSKTRQGYARGQTVFVLEDSQGTPWVLQSWSRGVDATLTSDGLATLERRLSLPPGWKFRTRVLDRDLAVEAVDGFAWIVRDGLDGTYVACFDQGEHSSCTFKP